MSAFARTPSTSAVRAPSKIWRRCIGQKSNRERLRNECTFKLFAVLVLPFIYTVTHRGRRGARGPQRGCRVGGPARVARREEGEYREYLTDEQRREAGCIAGRMPPYL